MRSKLFFLLIFISFTFAKSQQDSSKIKSYADQLSVRLNFDTNIEDYIYNFKGDGLDYESKVSINNNIKTSISLDYEIISAALSFSPNFIPGNNDNHLKGKSSYSEFRFRFFPKRFIFSAYYKNVKGFYLENMKDFYPDWKKGKDPYFQFPDLRVQSFGGSTSYVLNKNFSLKSIYYQREWQYKSSGSWIPSFDYDLTYFRTKTNGLKTKETQINFGANMGYHYNWVIGQNVNISPFLLLGFGGKFSSTKEENVEGKDRQQYFTIRTATGLHLGYNSDKFLYGAKINFDSNVYRESKNATIGSNSFYGLLYVGYRFAPPKFLKDNYYKLKEKVPIL